MARAIYDEVVDYEDGTPNNSSQIAKDVSEFLHWSSYPEMDDRKVLGIKTVLVTTVLLGLSIYWKRFKWSYLKSRQIVFKPQKVPNSLCLPSVEGILIPRLFIFQLDFNKLPL